MSLLSKLISRLKQATKPSRTPDPASQASIIDREELTKPRGRPDSDFPSSKKSAEAVTEPSNRSHKNLLLSRMSSEVATKHIHAFQRRFGLAHLQLAYHAALPLSLTPDLLYKLWANFNHDTDGTYLQIPWIAVADLLLSNLCRLVGYELYEMDLAIRRELLLELESDPRFGPKRIEGLADFLLEYIKLPQFKSDDPYTRDFAQVQEWTALAYTNPRQAATKLAQAFAESKNESTEHIRLASVAETLAQPDPEFTKLLYYARGMANLAYGNQEEAVLQFGEVYEVGEQKVLVGGVGLFIPQHIIQKLEAGTAQLRDLLQAEPDQPEYLYHLALAQLRQNQVESALQLLQRIIAESKEREWIPNARSLLAALWQQIQKDNLTASSVTHQLAILHHRWAIELEQEGQTETAKPHWHKAIANWVLLMEMDAFWQAWQAQQEAVYERPIKPDELTTWRRDGIYERLIQVHRDFERAYHKQQQKEQAAKHKEYRLLLKWERLTAAALREATERLRGQLAEMPEMPVYAGPLMLAELGLLEQAREVAAIAQNPDMPAQMKLAHTLADYLSPFGRWRVLIEEQVSEQLIDQLKIEQANEQTNPMIRRLLVRALIKLGQSLDSPREAVSKWVNALEYDPDNQEAQSLLAQHCIEQATRLQGDEIERAIETLTFGLKHAPDNQELKQNLSALLTEQAKQQIEQEKHQEARENLQKALELNNQNKIAKAIGIDLGTTNSVIAILDRGKPKILENATSRANPRLTPSVVAIGRDGKPIVGELAKGQPLEKTIFSIKRFMGRYFHNSTIQREIERVPYEVTENSQNGEVLVWLNGRPYSPPEISAFILESLKEQAETQIGGKVTHAVITVPAYFTERQKRATRLAGKLAGLEVMRLISEPTAAALAYGIDTSSTESQNILIYDLGGGTFNTTVFFVAAGVFVELSRVGDNQLGGDDFDQAIINDIVDKTKDKYKVNLSWYPEALQKLKAAAERAKIQLLKHQKVGIVIPNIAQDDHGHQVDIDQPLTRSEYERLIGPLVRQTIRLIERAIQEAKATPNEIDHVLLVGGSSVTPLIVQSLSKMFGPQKIAKPKVHPMYCVAAGAAIQSGILPLTSEETENDDSVVTCPNCARFNLNRPECRYCQSRLGPVEPLPVLEIVLIPIGLQTADDKMEIIIDKGTYYPTPEPISRVFRTEQPNRTALRLPIYQGFSKIASQNEYYGTVEVLLPSGLPVGTEVDLSFHIDANGIFNVTAELPEHPDLKVQTKIMLDLASEHGSAVSTPLWIQQALKILNQAGSIFLPFGQNVLTQEQIEIVRNLITQLQQSISMDDQALAEYKTKELKQAIQDIGQIGWLIYGNYLLAHLPNITPTEKRELEYLIQQGIQANTIGEPFELDASCTKIAALIDKIRQRIKSNAIDEIGLLQATRSSPLEEWWFPTPHSSK